MGEVCTLVLFIHNIMVLQRPKRHLVAIVVKPTDLPTHQMSQHNILHTPSAHSTGSRTHEPNSCQSTTFLTHSTTTIAKAYSCMHYSSLVTTPFLPERPGIYCLRMRVIDLLRISESILIANVNYT